MLCLAEPAALRHWRAGALLQSLRAADGSGLPLVEQELVIRGRAGPIRARLYRRADAPRGPGLVVAHGVHYRGIDEERLVPFARALSRAGLTVLTPELTDLADYRITADGVDTIADSVTYLSQRHDVVTQSRVGVLGFSFAGGLSLVAAERAELSQHLAFVASVGGHHDLARVLRFLLSSRVATPRGVFQGKAHEYGLVVLVYGQLDRLVPAADRDVMRSAMREWLHGDRDRARAIASARTTPEAEQLFSLLEHGKLAALRPRLERLIAEHAVELGALSSRGHLAHATVPIYLLHGASDDVIPASETEWAGLELDDKPHLALVSPLLEHVEVAHGAGVLDQLALVHFMAELL